MKCIKLYCAIATIPLIIRLHKMQSSSSVPVLILVLCCVASTHRALYDSAIHHLERRQEKYENCTLPTPLPCTGALVEYNRNPHNVTAATLDVACSHACLEPLNAFFLCHIGYEHFADFLCIEHYNNEYCIILYQNYNHSCLLPNSCNVACTNDCRSCQEDFINDLTCCWIQSVHYNFSFLSSLSDSSADACVNRFDTCNGTCYGDNCSGGAIAVPTVLTALLLMMMAAIVM